MSPKRHAITILLLFAFSMEGRAESPSQPPAEAKRHADACVKAYDLAEYQRAVDECKAAYEAFPAPLLLYSLGQAYRKLGDTRKALEFYRKYLAKAPNGSQHKAAEDQIRQLAPIVEAAERNRIAPPDGPGTEPSGEPRTRISQPPETPPPTIETAKPAPIPLPSIVHGVTTPPTRVAKRAFLVGGGVTLGLGAALLIAGGVCGGLALQANDRLNNPSDGMVYTRSLTEDVLTRQNASIALLAVGGAAVVAGSVVLVLGVR